MSRPDPMDVDPYKFAWDLKTPCSDCPFLKSTPLHDGIASGLSDMAGHDDHGNFVHSCHKTHPGADGWVESYKGPVQNCAGLTIMKIKKDDITWPMMRAVADKKLNLEEMDLSVETFEDLKDMAETYLRKHSKLKMHIRGKGWVTL